MAIYPGFVEAVMFLHPNANRNGISDFIVQDDGAGPYLKVWNLPGNPPTNAEVDAILPQIPVTLLLSKKIAAKSILDDDQPISRAQRAVINLIVGELNLLRGWITAFKAATAAATNLANLQIRVAALDAMPQRIDSQVITAIKNAIDTEG